MKTSFLVKHSKLGLMNIDSLDVLEQLKSGLGGTFYGPIEIPLEDEPSYEIAAIQLDEMHLLDIS